MAPTDFKPGDRLTLEANGQTYEGILIETARKDLYLLKLDNGYHVGIQKTAAKNVTKQDNGTHAGPRKAAEPTPPIAGLPTITILHTGGTIASRVDYKTGAVYASFEPQDLIAQYPELLQKANLRSVLLGNMFSGDLRLGHFQKIARAIATEVAKGDSVGIIITHGTDTMGYSAAASAFMLEHLPLPVLFVGAQRSSDRGSSDAPANLLGATEFILRGNYKGVGIAMAAPHNDGLVAIFSPVRTRKMHTSRRSTFRSIGMPPLAIVNPETGEIQTPSDPRPVASSGIFALKDKLEFKTGIQYVSPTLTPEQIAFYREHHYKGLVLVGTGLGHAPVHFLDPESQDNAKILEEIKKLSDSKCLVVMTSQCLNGRVNMNVYSYGRDLMAAGVLPGENMIPETALMKLAWLLGNNPTEKARELVGQNLRGEILERTDPTLDRAED